MVILSYRLAESSEYFKMIFLEERSGTDRTVRMVRRAPLFRGTVAQRVRVYLIDDTPLLDGEQSTGLRRLTLLSLEGGRRFLDS